MNYMVYSHGFSQHHLSVAQFTLQLNLNLLYSSHQVILRFSVLT